MNKGYDYSRSANPTRTALETCLASLEGADHGLAFSSGLGATTTIMHLLAPGDRVVSVNDVYGGTYRMFSQVYEPKGYQFDVPLRLGDRGRAWRSTSTTPTRIVWLETPTNPLLNLIDIAKAAEAAHAVGAMVVVDNDVRDPVPAAPPRAGRRHRRPLDDEVPRRPFRRDRRVRRDQRSDRRRAPQVPAEVARRGAGTVRLLARPPRAEDAGHPHGAPLRRTPAPSPRSSRSIPAVEKVLYPGLPDHPGHDIAARQMSDFGGMISFLAGSEEEARAIVGRDEGLDARRRASAASRASSRCLRE